MCDASSSPIEEGEIADDEFGNGLADTSLDNYESLNMDIESDSESQTKDLMKKNVGVDEADALRQLLLSQFNRKKAAYVSPLDRRRKPSISTPNVGHRRSGASPTKIDRKKGTPASAVEYTARPPNTEETRAVANGELRAMQRKLRKLQRRLVMARNQKRKILKELDDCETTIICCERGVGELADAMADVLRRVIEPAGYEPLGALESADGGGQTLDRRRSDSPGRQMAASSQSPNLDDGNGNMSNCHRGRLRGHMQRVSVSAPAKPINQLSPDKKFVAAGRSSPLPSSKFSNKNAILDEKLRELELEMAVDAQLSGSTPVDTSNSLDAGERLEPIFFEEEDEDLELVVREELVEESLENEGDDETAVEEGEAETTLILTPPPPPPTMSEMGRPPPDSTQTTVEKEKKTDNEPTTDSPPDAEARELEILSRMVLRRTQVQVENHQRELAAAAVGVPSMANSPEVIIEAEKSTIAPVTISSSIEEIEPTTIMTAEKLKKHSKQSALGFWMTRKRARLETAIAPSANLTSHLPMKSPIEVFCADKEIQKFKKSISMAKNVSVRSSGYAGHSVVPPSLPSATVAANVPSPSLKRRPPDSTLQSKVTQRELQSPLIFWHSYRQHSTNYRLTDVEIVCDFLRFNSLCPAGLSPETYATRLLERYSVEDVTRFLASKLPETMRNSTAFPPPASSVSANQNKATSYQPLDEASQRLEYNSSLPHYLSANGRAKILSE